jgi:hypothetical protein
MELKRRHQMGRYLTLWEVDESKIPLDPQERKVGWLGAIEMTKQSMKEGLVKDWGSFLGETKGLTIFEGTEEDVIKETMKYIPYFRFKIYPLVSIEKLEAAIKAM